MKKKFVILVIGNYHGFKNRTRPTGLDSGLVRSIGPEIYQIGIRPMESTVWPVNRTNQPVPKKPINSKDFNFSLKKKLENENITKDSMELKMDFTKGCWACLMTQPTTHIPIPLYVGWVLSPQAYLKPLLRMAFIGVIWLLVPLSCRCGIAKYQRKKT